MARLIPDNAPEAVKLVDTVTGLVVAGRRDRAIAHLTTALGIVWGEGWLAGMGESIQIDKDAQDRAAPDGREG
jgi:hypothetical protein